MKGLIVIEGADCSGKSTLVDYLVKHHRAVSLHATWSPALARRMWSYHHGLLARAVDMAKKKLVVLDRLWLSEAIYARVYRGGTAIPHEGRLLQRVLNRYGAVTIICRHPQPACGADTIMASAKRRYEMWEAAGRQKLVELCQAYDDVLYGDAGQQKDAGADYAATLARAGGLRRLGALDYTIAHEGKNLGEFVRKVFARLDQQPRFSALTRNLVGCPTAEVLVCGDQLNLHRVGARWPFIDYGGSSLFLAQAFDQLGTDERRLAFTNINDDHGRAAVRFARQAHPSLVLCLGRRAYATAAKLSPAWDGAVLDTVPHPQWARRFSTLSWYCHQLLRFGL